MSHCSSSIITMCALFIRDMSYIQILPENVLRNITWEHNLWSVTWGPPVISFESFDSIIRLLEQSHVYADMEWFLANSDDILVGKVDKGGLDKSIVWWILSCLNDDVE